MKLYLVRHGENIANLTKEFSCRQIDYDLTDKGYQQAIQTAEYFKNKKIDLLFSSPMKRAIQTVERISTQINKPYNVIEDLREIDVGDLEKMDPSFENWNIYFKTLEEWFSGNIELRFPNGESYSELLSRFRHALIQIVKEKQYENVVVVGHGGIFTVGIGELCNIVNKKEFSSQQNHNCSISTFDISYDNSEFKVNMLQWANHNHLTGSAAIFVNGLPFK